MNPASKTIGPNTFLKNAFACWARFRIQNSGWSKAYDYQRGSAEFGDISKRADNIDFGVNCSGAVGAILAYCQYLATVKEHGNVIVCAMLRRIPILVT